MRSYSKLYEEIASFQNLLKASRLAQRGKRFKNATAFFNVKLEKELWRLHEYLKIKRYKPGRYHQFTIYEPKKRLISAAPYRDRVVHHAIHNVLFPIFDKTFIDDSYATRMGKGTHAAIEKFQNFARKCGAGHTGLDRWKATTVIPIFSKWRASTSGIGQSMESSEMCFTRIALLKTQDWMPLFSLNV